MASFAPHLLIAAAVAASVPVLAEPARAAPPSTVTSDAPVLLAQSRRRRRRPAPKPPPEEEVTEESDTGGFGLDLTEETQPEEPPPPFEEPPPPPVAAPEPAPAPEPPPAPPMKLRFGPSGSGGVLAGLPNTFPGFTVRVNSQLQILPWLSAGAALGFGEWFMTGGEVEDRPGYYLLGTVEAELTARAAFGAPFAELGFGTRLFTVEAERRGYLAQTRPFVILLGGGYSLQAGLPVDAVLRVGITPGPRPYLSVEAQAIVWVF